MPLLILLAGLFAGLCPAAGAQTLALDADTAAAMAVERNLSLLASHLDLGARERARGSRWNLLVPALSATASLTRTYPGSAGLGVGLDARLELSAASSLRMRDAVLAYEAGFLDLQTARRQLERDVRISFYGLIVGRRRAELAEQSIATSQRRLEIARQNFELGRVSELDLLNVQVALENLRPALAQARLDYQIEEMRFKDFLGLEAAAEITLAGSLEPASGQAGLDGLLRLAETSPQIQAFLRERLILSNQKKLAVAEGFAPVLGLSYSYDPVESWSAHSFRLGLALPLDSWIPRSQGRLRVKEIDDSLSRLELELAAARRQMEIQVRSLALGLSKSRTGMEAGQKNVELAGKAYELAEREYQAGLVDLLTVLEAYDRLQEAQLDSLGESYSYQVGLLNLAFLLNIAPERLLNEGEE